MSEEEKYLEITIGEFYEKPDHAAFFKLKKGTESLKCYLTLVKTLIENGYIDESEYE